MEEELQKLRKTIPNNPGSKDDASQSASEREAGFRQWAEGELDPKMALAKFALIRWDELDELAYRLTKRLRADSSGRAAISIDMLRKALRRVSDSQWRKNKSYADHARDEKSERRDYQMAKVWEVHSGDLKAPLPGISISNGRKWLMKAVDSLQDVQILNHILLPVEPGAVKIVAEKSSRRRKKRPLLRKRK